MERGIRKGQVVTIIDTYITKVHVTHTEDGVIVFHAEDVLQFLRSLNGQINKGISGQIDELCSLVKKAEDDMRSQNEKTNS